MWIFNYDLNIVWAILIFFTVFMIIYNGFIIFLEPYLPTCVLELFRYGKTLNGPVQSSLVNIISVPKSYFTHFYVFACLYIPTLLLLAAQHYHQPNLLPPSPSISLALDIACTSSRVASSSSPPSSILLVLGLLCLQVLRRLYECVYINQPSKSTMNLTHYIVGFAHYFCTGTGVLCEAPGFSPGISTSSTFSFSTVLLVLVFLWAWYQQLVAHKTFAALKIASPTKHSVPYGGMFQLVSCPHYTMEIVMYGVIMLLLGLQHHTAVLVCVWVTINQLIAGTMSHQWYRNTFRDYPEERKAIIPYIL